VLQSLACNSQLWQILHAQYEVFHVDVEFNVRTHAAGVARAAIAGLKDKENELVQMLQMRERLEPYL